MSDERITYLQKPGLGEIFREEWSPGMFGEWTALIPSPFASTWDTFYLHAFGSFYTAADRMPDPVKLEFKTSDSTGPNNIQTSSWHALTAKASDVEQECLGALHQMVNARIDWEIEDSVFDSERNNLIEGVAQRCARQLDQVCHQTRLRCITLFVESHEGKSFYQIRFAWSWDEDCSVSLLFWNQKCLGGKLASFQDDSRLHAFLPGGPMHESFTLDTTIDR